MYIFITKYLLSALWIFGVLAQQPHKIDIISSRPAVGNSACLCLHKEPAPGVGSLVCRSPGVFGHTTHTGLGECGGDASVLGFGEN